MPIYMKFEGARPSIPGTVKEAAHLNWVEVDSLQLGRMTQGGSGTAVERGASTGSPQEVVLTLPMNASAQAMWTNLLNGGPPMTVTVDFVSGKDKQETYLSLTLEQALFSSFSVSGDSSGSHREGMASGALNCTKVVYIPKGKAAL